MNRGNPDRQNPRVVSGADFSTTERMKTADSKYDLKERLLCYAADIIRLVEELPTSRAGNHIAGQLLKSGTSALPNHAEGQAAESADDFVHKFKLCLKELRETDRWLQLIQRVPLLPGSKVKALIDETDELIRIFHSSIQTARRNSLGSTVGNSVFTGPAPLTSLKVER